MGASLVLALLVGISLGLLGGGGSILAVPIFVYVARLEPKQAVALSLLVVGAISLVGALQHWRAGRVQVRVAVGFGLWAMGGTWAGTRVATWLSGSAQLVIFALVMLAAALAMLRNSSGPPREAEPRKAHWVQSGALGIFVGLLTGIVGVGGGFLIVPALALLGGLPMAEAVGTSLLVIGFNATVGFLGYLGQVEVPWAFAFGFFAVATAGTVVGNRLVTVLPGRVLKRAFALFILVVAVAILIERRHVFL